MHESPGLSIIYNDEELETVKTSNNWGMAGKVMGSLPNGFTWPFKSIMARRRNPERCLGYDFQ